MIMGKKKLNSEVREEPKDYDKCLLIEPMAAEGCGVASTCKLKQDFDASGFVTVSTCFL